MRDLPIASRKLSVKAPYHLFGATDQSFVLEACFDYLKILNPLHILQYLYHINAMNAAPITANTPLLICNCEAAPGNGNMVAEPVGLGDVDVEVLLPVRLRFRQICFTRAPNAVSLISIILNILNKRRENGRYFMGKTRQGVTYLLNQSSCKSKSSADRERR